MPFVREVRHPLVGLVHHVAVFDDDEAVYFLWVAVLCAQSGEVAVIVDREGGVNVR